MMNYNDLHNSHITMNGKETNEQTIHEHTLCRNLVIGITPTINLHSNKTYFQCSYS